MTLNVIYTKHTSAKGRKWATMMTRVVTVKGRSMIAIISTPCHDILPI